jgi:hypothetical protein
MCFRFHRNSNYTCVTDHEYYIRPFRDQEDLEPTTIFNHRLHSQQNFDICYRRECKYVFVVSIIRCCVPSCKLRVYVCRVTPFVWDGNYLWFVAETFVNSVFLLEITARVYMASSLQAYASYLPNWFDVLSIVPYIVQVITAAVNGE